MSASQWKSVFDSVVGTSHESTGLPCQDCSRVVAHALETGEYLIVLCADGAGSASHSSFGSELACDTLMALITAKLDGMDSLASISRDLVLEWYSHIREKIEVRSTELDVEPRQLATTSMGAIIAIDSAIFFQIGDGAMVIREGDNFRHVFWPQSGEYANTTNFVTDVHFDSALAFLRLEQTVDEIVAFTDGLERLILQFNSQSVHSGFFEPMLAVLRTTEDTESLFEPLRNFLSSNVINLRTNDDKTLVLATRRDG